MSEQQPIEVSRIKPIGAKLLVRKCIRKDAGLIILPDQAKDTTSYCEILAVGNKCKFFGQQHIGMTCQVPEYGDGLHFLVEGSSEYAIVKEDIIEPIAYDS